MTTMRKTRITTILGTRPELIRLSCILEKLEENFDHRLIHTGQNFDDKLSGVFIDELKIKNPDVFLNSSRSSLGNFLASTFVEIEKDLDKHPTDAVVILGDTNSALSGIIPKRRGIPVYHLEAGNRSFDANVPEEINRKIVDHFSDFNLAYTSHAKANLIKEGIHPRTVAVIGSPLFEVLAKATKQIGSSKILSKLGVEAGQFFLVSAHRQENIDNQARLEILIAALSTLSNTYKLPVIVSGHPRLRDKIEQLNNSLGSMITVYEPFGFFDYNKLQISARVVLSDSGSIAEEAAILGFPAVTIRDSMERPEALESGSIVMSGLTSQGILECVELIERVGISSEIPAEYLISDTSSRVVKFIESTYRQHAFWNGLRN
jgi:UDP-N-acetyl-L-fucosamine synthase